jgi:hypothetical protein
MAIRGQVEIKMQPTNNHSHKSDSDKELLPLNVLLHCRTVVEGQHFVTTGVMTHVEGELFEVELHEYDQFELGETVKLTVYSPAGIQSLPSVVFAKYEGAIALLQPPEVLKRFIERREHPRVAITGSMQIIQVLQDSGARQELTEPIQLTVTDISLSGLGFLGPNHLQLDKQMKLMAKVNIGLEFNCELEIVRRDRVEEGLLCGAKMHIQEPDMLRPLRAIILRQQVTKNAEIRRGTEKKRHFQA